MNDSDNTLTSLSLGIMPNTTARITLRYFQQKTNVSFWDTNVTLRDPIDIDMDTNTFSNEYLSNFNGVILIIIIRKYYEIIIENWYSV